jgi:hypothetical protein
LQKPGEILEIDAIGGSCRGERDLHGGFVVVAQEVFVVVRRAAEGGIEELFWEDDVRPQTVAVKGVIAFADSVETVAGCDDPGVRCGTMKVATKVLEDGGAMRSDGSEVVEGLIDACSEACRGHIVAEDAAIDELCIEGGLGNKVVEKMWDVLLALRSKGLFVARTAAEGDDNDLLISKRSQ